MYRYERASRSTERPTRAAAKDEMRRYLSSANPSVAPAMDDFLDIYYLEIKLQFEYLKGREANELADLQAARSLGSENISKKMNKKGSSYKEAMSGVKPILTAYQQEVQFIGFDSPRFKSSAIAWRSSQIYLKMRRDLEDIAGKGLAGK